MNLFALSTANVELLNTYTYNLTITLVVFVLLTALLAAFIIMLFAWKRFRDFFFKDNKSDNKKKKSKKQSNAENAVKSETPEKATADKNAQSVKTAKQQTEPQRTAKRKTQSEPRYSDSYYDNGVPTVPLDGSAEFTMTTESAKQSAKRSNTLYKIPTVVITTPKTAVRTKTVGRTTAHRTQEIKKPTAVKAVKTTAKIPTAANKKTTAKTPRKNGK